MTGSFLFVKPSDPEGKRGTAYSGEVPRYPYDRASWEWLLERALRRTLLPWALTKSHSRALLHGHEDKYSMHRWGSFGRSYVAGATPSEYQSVGGPGAVNRKTDANLSSSDRNASLPESWDIRTGTPVVSSTKTAYGMTDLEETVARLPFSLEWLHPGWSPSALDAWDLVASTTETTQGSAPASPDGLAWTWETTVNHIPYTIPNEVPFKCLSHMRTDDPTTTVNITNDDNETISVETAPTSMSAPRTAEGSIREYNGTQVREGSQGAALGAGWALSEFYIIYKKGSDYSPGTSSIAYRRDGKTYELGNLVDVPDKDSGNILVQRDTYDVWAGFVHETDWNGRQTWWHANGFPKGLGSVLSAKLKTQLNALCPVCQPAIPPAVPALCKGFPGPGTVQWDYWWIQALGYSIMYPQNWMQHLALACTPVDMSARLAAMTTTVHKVPAMFAKIRTVTKKHRITRYDEVLLSGSQSWSLTDYSYEATTYGTSSHPIPTTGDVLASESVSGQGNSITSNHTTITDQSGSGSYGDETQTTREESFESNSEFLVCLRSTANTSFSTKTVEKISETTEYSDRDPESSSSESSYGDLPESYDPDPDDLLFPDWVLPWIETAELFASIESRLVRADGYDYNSSEYRNSPHVGETTYLYSGSGAGTQTHMAHRKIVSLGQMNTSTGRFPSVDAAAVVSAIDPDPTEPTWEGPASSDTDTTTTETTDSSGNKTKRTIIISEATPSNGRLRSVSYYVVVKWKFDRTDPESLETESSLADLHRKLADARKALSDKRRELSDAQSTLSSSESELQSANDALSLAQERRDSPEDAEPDLLEEAQAALDSANEKLSDARSEKADAQGECSTAESGLQSAERNLRSAQDAYDAAVESGEGVEEAQAALNSANTAYNSRSKAYGEAYSGFADAAAGETSAQTAADAAQEYLDTLPDRLEEILQKAVNDAQTAVNEAASKVEEWTQKVDEIEEAIPDLEDAVEAAEQAVRDAGGTVP